MSAVIDVGDAIELTFESAPGATVTASWFTSAGVAVLDHVPVTETPAGTGKFPYTFTATAADIWRAEFTATGTAVAVQAFYVRAIATDGPAPLATVGEVVELYGPMTPAQEALTGALLRRASAMVRYRFADIDDRIAQGTLPADIAALAVINMVLRVMRNSRGVRSQTVGPFTVTFDTSYSLGLLELTAGDLGMLNPQNRGARVVAATIMARPGLPHAWRPW